MINPRKPTKPINSNNSTNYPKPTIKPKNPNFSSGPCRKYADFAMEQFDLSWLGRSHRSTLIVRAIQDVLALTKELLQIPADYHLALVPGSATGAMEMGFWNLLGPRPVHVLNTDLFAEVWLHDLLVELGLPEVIEHNCMAGLSLEQLSLPINADLVVVLNGTTSGVLLPASLPGLVARYQAVAGLVSADITSAELVSADITSSGLVFADITSAAFALPIPWELIDVAGFGCHKGLGGEAGYGLLALSPRAIARLQTYTPAWPVPRVLRLFDRKNGHRKLELFTGYTLNSISTLCLQDHWLALQAAKKLGGLDGWQHRVAANYAVLANWLQDQGAWLRFAVAEPSFRSPISLCLQICEPRVLAWPVAQQWQLIKQICDLLAEEQVAYDIKGHALAAPCLRIWAGTTIETADLAALLPWLLWAGKQVLAEYLF